MKYCSRCGKQCADDSSFCSECGAAFSSNDSKKNLTSFFDIFRINKLRSEIKSLSDQNKNLQSKIADMDSLLTPEMKEYLLLSENLNKLRENIHASEKRLSDLSLEAAAKEKEMAESVKHFDSLIAEKKSQIITLDDKILVQSFGLYEPKFDFSNSEKYKEMLDFVREQQANMIRNKTAATGSTDWTVNGDAAKGKRMVQDMQKLLLRAFNSECDSAISKVKYNNCDTMVKRIETSCEAISKLGKIMGIRISDDYLRAKFDELNLALEWQMKKHEESERLKELRAEQREEARLLKEIAEQRKKAEKEKQHYLNALADIEKSIQSCGDQVDPALLEKKDELSEKLVDIQEDLEDIDYRETNQKAGYVYIISNIGSFGEGVYKIGMTRRLDPKERIDELGDASVPFNFDIHAMIFTEDAPALENALHHAFEDRKLNMVNQRREFFRVSLDEIKEVVRNNFDKTVEFFDVPDADQFRISKMMREGNTP